MAVDFCSLIILVVSFTLRQLIWTTDGGQPDGTDGPRTYGRRRDGRRHWRTDKGRRQRRRDTAGRDQTDRGRRWRPRDGHDGTDGRTLKF